MQNAPKINFGKKLEAIIEENERAGKVPKLLLHGCCAPCSSYCLEYLSKYFEITLFYYNPNITDIQEYDKRAAEVVRLVKEQPAVHPVNVIIGEHEPERFCEIAKGLENVPEGGERCFRCYRLRLEAAARRAKERGADYFCTTLSISPLKNAAKLNEIGAELSEIYKIPWLPSDFKKKGGYLRSIELSKEYGLYRQNYCGCPYSIRKSSEP